MDFTCSGLMYRGVPLLFVRFASFSRNVTSPKSPIFIFFVSTKNMLLGCRKRKKKQYLTYKYQSDILDHISKSYLAMVSFTFTY